MQKLKVFLTDGYNPHLNLATEEWIFHNLDATDQILFLWRNEETVVIGRNQNPWSECNLAAMKENRVHLARRNTGGGAVYHDLGNTNFTFLSPRDSYKRENNIAIIFNALKELGIQGEASGRNDLLVSFADGARKFSGSAYREKKDRAFHHGTIMMSIDLSRLGNYLTPNPKKLKAKGKESVRARVANLNELVPDISHDKLAPLLIRSFEQFYGQEAEITHLSLKSLQEIPELKEQYEKLSSWEWLYGNTLEFSHKMDDYLSLGFFDFHFQVEEARIKDLKIYTDCLYPALIEELTEGFKDQPYTSTTVNTVFNSLKGPYTDIETGLIELRDWLAKNIEI